MKGRFQFLEFALYLLSQLQTQHIRHLNKRSNVDQSQSQLYLGRVGQSALGWYQKGPCVN